jgi:hypothetical protein
MAHIHHEPFEAMSTAAVLEQIHALPPDERERLFDALWPEAQNAWLRRQREDEEDIRAADEALRQSTGGVPLRELMKEWGDEL